MTSTRLRRPAALALLVGIVALDLHAQTSVPEPAVRMRRVYGMRRGTVAADFNKDGFVDLVGAKDESGPARTMIAFGRSDGTFARATETTAGGEPLLATDFNNDGNLDLVTRQLPSPDESVDIYRGNGNGTFTHASLITWYYEAPHAATADFNRDGNLDIAITGLAEGPESGVVVILGDGALGFSYDAASRIYIGTGQGAAGLTTADFDRDGRVDIAVANSGSNTVSILLNRGTLLYTQSHLAFDRAPNDVTTADVNRDGRLDLIIAASTMRTGEYGTHLGFGPGSAYVLFGNGNGSFQIPRTYATGTGAFHVATGDFNWDGRLDIVTANFSAGTHDMCTGTTTGINTATVLPGVGTGGFAAGSTFALGDQRDTRGVIGGAASLSVVDVNRDGRRDIVASHGDMLMPKAPDPNWPPTVNAGPDASISSSTPVTLRASVEEPDLDAVTYQWRSSDGRSIPGRRAVCLGTLTPGSYTFTVTVSDRHGHTASDSVAYTVSQ